MRDNRPLAALLTTALVLAVLVLLLVGGSLAWLDAEGAEEELPVSYRLRLTCPRSYVTVFNVTPNTWWRTVYVGRSADDPDCSWGAICYSRWSRADDDGVWPVYLHQNDGVAVRRNLLVELFESYDQPLTVYLWPATECAVATWLPVVERY